MHFESRKDIRYFSSDTERFFGGKYEHNILQMINRLLGIGKSGLFLIDDKTFC